MVRSICCTPGSGMADKKSGRQAAKMASAGPPTEKYSEQETKIGMPFPYFPEASFNDQTIAFVFGIQDLTAPDGESDRHLQTMAKIGIETMPHAGINLPQDNREHGMTPASATHTSSKTRLASTCGTPALMEATGELATPSGQRERTRLSGPSSPVPRSQDRLWD